MKLTKSELKTMIREVLREELNTQKRARINESEDKLEKQRAALDGARREAALNDGPRYDVFKKFGTDTNVDDKKDAKNKSPVKEAVSGTYMAAYNKLAKKFIAAIQEADEIWTSIVCDYGCELGYYTESVNKRLKAAAKKNILAGVTNDSIEVLCITGISKIDDAFSDYVDQEGETFDEALGDACYCETFICYTDGSYKYFNSYEDTFIGNTDDIECIIGIDYASGSNIAWIRGEDDIDDLESYLNI